MSYRNLEIWKLAEEIFLETHHMTVHQLPRHELYENGSQIRRATQSAKSNIVEGYGYRCYKKAFIRYLIIARSSAMEALDQLESLYQSGSLKDKETYDRLHRKMAKLTYKLLKYIQYVKSAYPDQPPGSPESAPPPSPPSDNTAPEEPPTIPPDSP